MEPFNVIIPVRLADDQLQQLARMVAKEIREAGLKETYTPEEAAKRIGCSRRTILRHVEAGLLRKVPNIGKTLIPAESLDRMLQRNPKPCPTGSNG